MTTEKEGIQINLMYSVKPNSKIFWLLTSTEAITEISIENKSVRQTITRLALLL